jgi:DNA-binding SARP family transcriptional activator
MPKLALYLLGPPRIELDGQAIPLGRRKAVALLTYLALTRQPHSRDALATLLWPELDQSKARAGLRSALSSLNTRQAQVGWR